jgi:hypothetical protein
MSTYNLIYGATIESFFVIPLLFGKHPNELPRFRNCWIIKNLDGYEIKILSRIGKKYFDEGYGEEMYLNHELFLRFENKLITKEFTDDTYGNYFFKIPNELKEDIVHIFLEKYQLISEENKELIKNIFPKLEKQLSKLLYRIDPQNN